MTNIVMPRLTKGQVAYVMRRDPTFSWPGYCFLRPAVMAESLKLGLLPTGSFWEKLSKDASLGYFRVDGKESPAPNVAPEKPQVLTAIDNLPAGQTPEEAPRRRIRYA